MASNTQLRLAHQTDFTALLGSVNNTSDVNKPVSTPTQNALNLKADVASYSTTSAMNSAISAAAAKLFKDRGNFTPAADAFPSATSTNPGSGTGGVVMQGDIWTIDGNGPIGGVTVTAGDLVRALVNSPAVLADWSFTENNIGYAPENSANKSGILDAQSTSAQFPTSAATFAAVNAKLTKNTAITGAEHTKITYDASGLVTSGSAATTADIAASFDKNYITNAQQTQLAISAKYFRKTGFTKDGSAYTLAFSVNTDSEQVFQNGMLMRVGATHDYTMTGDVITFIIEPAPGDAIVLYGVR